MTARDRHEWKQRARGACLRLVREGEPNAQQTLYATERTPVRAPRDVVQVMMPLAERELGEVVWIIALDSQHRMIGDAPIEVTRGILNSSLVHPQPTYVEVWFEKDALMGVFERIANELRVPFFSCRGYTSDSEVWGAAQRLRRKSKDFVILHFGDHDPSGIDMTRDIRERLALFGASNGEVRRLALNMPQVEQYDPPPNPAKETDSRFANYQELYGDESWELDALEPTVLAALVRDEVMRLIDADAWTDEIAREEKARAQLQAISENYASVVSEFAPDDEEDA